MFYKRFQMFSGVLRIFSGCSQDGLRRSQIYTFSDVLTCYQDVHIYVLRCSHMLIDVLSCSLDVLKMFSGRSRDVIIRIS